MRKNDMLLIFGVLGFFILMWIHTVTKACVHPRQGSGPKPLQGDGKCFRKLLWAPNQAQDKTRSLVKDKKQERKENRSSTSQLVSVSWFCGNSPWGMQVFSVHREHGIGILTIVLHYIEYSVFCKVFCGASRLSSLGKHWSPRCDPGCLRAAGKGKSKSARRALCSCTESLMLCRQKQPVSGWLSPRAPKQKGCLRQVL